MKIICNERNLRRITICSCIFVLFFMFQIGFFLHNDIDPIIIKLYQSQINERKLMLKNVPDIKNFFILYNVLVPEVFCKNLVRIGNIGDGGKWICNPNKILSFSKPCTVYSLGIRNDASFDQNFQNFTNEATLKIIKKSNGIFMKALISGNTNFSNLQYTFKDLLNKFDDKRIDILKIDIEGAEFDISEELISVQMCQILMEIHGETALKTLKLLRKLSKNGYYLFSYEINGMFHHLSEYSFIHENCFKDFGITEIYGKYLS